MRGGILIAAAICGISRLCAQGAGASVAGVVVDETTGAPLRRAVVGLYLMGDGPVSAQDVSDAEGRFGFSNLPPGKYGLRGEKDGYEPRMLGAKHIGQPGVVLTLTAGDARWNLRLAIAPYGTITGTVRDGDGDPLPDADVEILQLGWERGKPKWQQRGAAKTDDRGEYRLQGVSAGNYCAMAAQTQNPSAPGERGAYAMQIYAGADRLSKATQVQVA